MRLSFIVLKEEKLSKNALCVLLELGIAGAKGVEVRSIGSMLI